jgi:DNA-binding MarR family transcriptional regulator
LQLARSADGNNALDMKNSAVAHLRSIHHSGRVSNRIANALQAVRSLVQALSQSSGAVERKTGITNAQLFLLQQIQKERNPTVNDLATLAMTSQSTVSIVLSRLERRGLVVRERSLTDARSVVLRLTAPGKRLLRRAPRPATSEVLRALSRLSSVELRAVSRGLGALDRELGLTVKPPSMLFEDDGRGWRQTEGVPRRRGRKHDLLTR